MAPNSTDTGPQFSRPTLMSNSSHPLGDLLDITNKQDYNGIIMEPTFSVQDAQKVLDEHLNKYSKLFTAHSVEGVCAERYSYSPSTQSYLIHSTVGPQDSPDVKHYTHLILLIWNAPSPHPVLPNSLTELQILHSLITANTDIPLPALYGLSKTPSSPTTASRTKVELPYEYALFDHPAQSELRSLSSSADDGQSPEDMRIDLRIGVHLRNLHALQNDWFGHPVAPAPVDPCYSWQDAFIPLIEEVIDTLQKSHAELCDYSVLRKVLSRAYGSFLFEDVEVPSLVLGAGGLGDIWVSKMSNAESNEGEREVVGIHPRCLLHALWGDPLMESLLLPPGPSQAMREGYTGGGPLVLFGRQQTKRLWYLLYEAGLVVCQGGKHGLEWAEQTVKECAEKLRNAPCY